MPADVARQRLDQALGLAELSPGEFAGALLPTMFSDTTPPEAVDAFGASMLRFHPAGFRAMARASAEDLREVLPHINVPTLLIYGDRDVRAPLTVAEDLKAAILARPWSCCRTPATSAISKPLRSSTAQSAASSATCAADHLVRSTPRLPGRSAPTSKRSRRPLPSASPPPGCVRNFWSRA